MHLLDFAESNQITEKDIKSAESFLVNVLTSDPSIKTFDDLRLKKFTHKVSLMDLPPTSFSIVHGHVPRWWYITKLCTSLLDSNCDLDPLEYGWYLDMSNILLPIKYLNPLPDEYTSFCSCRGDAVQEDANVGSMVLYVLIIVLVYTAKTKREHYYQVFLFHVLINIWLCILIIYLHAV